MHVGGDRSLKTWCFLTKEIAPIPPSERIITNLARPLHRVILDHNQPRYEGQVTIHFTYTHLWMKVVNRTFYLGATIGLPFANDPVNEYPL